MPPGTSSPRGCSVEGFNWRLPESEEWVRVSIGIDLGSSRVKLLALDEGGECLGVTMASYATESRKAGYAEQNPDRWWDALRLAMSELLARPALRGSSVIAVGLTGQMHGAVFLDDKGAALRPALMLSLIHLSE